MQITLPPEVQAIIDREIEAGHYNTPEDVIVDAFRHLEDDQHAYDPMRDPKVIEAIAQMEHGDVYEVNDKFRARVREQVAEDFARGAEISDDVKY